MSAVTQSRQQCWGRAERLSVFLRKVENGGVGCGSGQVEAL